MSSATFVRAGQMSVLIKNEQGWLVSHQVFVDKLYGKCFENDILINLKFRSEFFQINTPLLMNSAALKRSQDCLTVERKKKAKKKKEDSGFHHLQAKSLIECVTDLLCNEGRNKRYLQNSEVLPTEWFENNSSARLAAKELNCKCYTCDECLRFTKSFTNQYEHFGNDKEYPIIKTIGKNKYVLPPYSSCYVGDVRNILSVTGTRYDVVLLDPPWKNKSVKRKKGYMTLTNDDLLCIPVHQLTKPGSIVIVWATNNENQISFVREKLFEAWNVKYCVTWYWAKITQKGILVHPIDSHQKKPYENIIFGRVHCDEISRESGFHVLEPDKVIVSVPSSIHSHKPPLSEILKSYVPEDAKCLELFARSLLPGWTSYGNEVLKLQNLQLFENVECSVN